MFTLIADEAELDQYMQAKHAEYAKLGSGDIAHWIQKGLLRYPLLIACSFIPFHNRSVFEYHWVDARDAYRLLTASGAREQRSLVL